MAHTEKQLNSLLESGELASAKGIVDSLNISALESVSLLVLCAMVYRRLNDPRQAEKFSSRAAGIDPGNIPLLIDFAGDLIKLGRVDTAEAVLDTIPSARQEDSRVVLQRSKILYQKKEFASAVKLLVGLVKRTPAFSSAHMELAHALLMHGKWPAGWQEYEWRYRLPKTIDMFPKFKMPHWDGSDGLAHILLIADQGYGDCFQFCRYIPLVAQKCSRVSLIRSQPLARLMDSIPSISFSYTQWEDTPLASAYCTLSGLPRLFATRPDTIPDCLGILKADAGDVRRWEERLNGVSGDTALKVGVVWSGRVEFEGNYLRAVPPEEIAVLFDVSGVQFFSLQVGTPASQMKSEGVIDLSAELSDFAETAAAMEGLDLIITSDTSVAHLAGTLGRPTWVLLNFAPDWRWGHEGSGSLWYPSVRLFRQDQTRNWGSVLDECKSMLNDIAVSEDPVSFLESVTRYDSAL